MRNATALRLERDVLAEASRPRTRIVWLAVAEGRGHLMRAQLATQLLAPIGIDVEVVTTAPAGVAFLAEFGLPAAMLSTRYSLIYDNRQNIALGRTRAMALRYLGSPFGCARDLARLSQHARGAALVVNDSFHPALLASTLFGGDLARRVVHVHTENTRCAVEIDAGRGPVGRMMQASLARSTRIEITLGDSVSEAIARDAPVAGALVRRADLIRLPPLLPLPRSRELVRAELGVPAGRRLAVVYLNPYFHDAALASAIEVSLAAAGFVMHAVGEGYAGRPGWRARDAALPDAVGAADVFISAPGSGALALARATAVPMIAIATDQPEQRRNLDTNDGAYREAVGVDGDVRADLAAALAALPAHAGAPNSNAELAVRRSRALWQRALIALVERDCNRKEHP